MELPSQPDLWQLHDRDNTFNPWGAGKRGDWRPRDYGDDGSLSGFNSGNNIPGPSRTSPEPEPQGKELFPRNGFVNRANPQAVMGLPETHSEISSRKEMIQLLASSKENCKAETIIHTPPVKRWRFGNLQIPIITCSKQSEEDDSGQKSEVGKTNENPAKMHFWSFEEKKEITEEIKVNNNSAREITEKFEFNSALFGGVAESSCDKVCENRQKEIEEYSRSLECQSYLKEKPTSRKESQKTSLVLADSCHDSAANEILTNGSHLPLHHTLVSVRTSDFDQNTEDKEKASAVETEPAKVEHVCHNAGKWNNIYGVQRVALKHCVFEILILSGRVMVLQLNTPSSQQSSLSTSQPRIIIIFICIAPFDTY